jgi:hypothetical protein
MMDSVKLGLARTSIRWGIPVTVLAVLALGLTLPAPKPILRAESASQSTTAQGTPPVDPAIADLLGLSGDLRAVIGTPDALAHNPALSPLVSGLPVDAAWPRWPKLATSLGESLAVVPIVPFRGKTSRSGSYRVGFWPDDALAAKNSRYVAPRGFIEVTPENQATSVSKHFTLRDFLTHDQTDVWPKALVLSPALLDKLELIHDELEREGLPSRLHVMSGFRTPQYNALGVGRGGRASHSRHMYGDAADVFIDGDMDGVMDDVNHDGRITLADAQVLRSAAERVEAEYPSLVGGLSAYPANSAHGPFVHVDARGVKARW